MTDDFFQRTELMLGAPAMARLRRTRVALFGLGGVGGWCAEALARSGVGHMLLVDADCVCRTNINRQLVATAQTLGRAKVDVLAARLRAIHPDISLDARAAVYSAATAEAFALETYDYVIDAIDALADKASLIRHALAIPSVTLFASMGAALKMDPFQIRATAFTQVAGDALARALRVKFKKTGGLPTRPFTCVWSPERRENRGTVAPEADDAAVAAAAWRAPAARVNGTVAHTTAMFGLALAGLVVADCERRAAAEG